MNHQLPQNNQPNPVRPPFVPPRITTYTDDELLEAMGPVLANTSQVGSGLFGTPDPFLDPNFTFPGEE
ncbi:MAG: hypothetical protein FOGNACKC_03169 [Anaerolineae bacterium]|nr:hypothetical protein [Anaerolineae bacterium]